MTIYTSLHSINLQIQSIWWHDIGYPPFEHITTKQPSPPPPPQTFMRIFFGEIPESGIVQNEIQHTCFRDNKMQLPFFKNITSLKPRPLSFPNDQRNISWTFNVTVPPPDHWHWSISNLQHDTKCLALKMYAAGSQNKNNTTDMKGGTGCYSGQHNRINGVSVKTRVQTAQNIEKDYEQWVWLINIYNV